MSAYLVSCALCGTQRYTPFDPVWLDEYLTIYCSQVCLIEAERQGLKQAFRDDAMLQQGATQARERQR